MFFSVLGSKTSKLSQQKLSPKKERAFRRAGDPKLQAKRRRTREDIEPDSIPLLSMSTTSDSESNNEEVGSKRSRLCEFSYIFASSFFAEL